MYGLKREAWIICRPSGNLGSLKKCLMPGTKKLSIAQPYSMVHPTRIEFTDVAAIYTIKARLRGAFVECGT